MSVVFPNNNLPTASQPWGREVTKQLSNIISSSTASQINNAARDNQLNSSIIALNGVVQEVSVVAEEAADAATAAAAAAATANSAATNATNAINGLIGLGSDGSSYNINANNITAGNIIAGSSSAGISLMSQDGTGFVQAWNDNARMRGGSATVQCSGSTILLTTAVSALSSLTVSGNIRAPGITSTTFLQAENHAGGGTTGASINNNGTIIRTSSSERYKQDIENLSVDYDDLLSLEPKRFRLKDEAAESPDARYYAGFIAEEIDQTSLKDFVAYRKMEDGSVIPDGVYYGELTAALLQAIKHQDALIKSLNERISLLEGDKVE